MQEKVTILVLEDDPDLRDTLEEVLLDEGYEVDTAARGQQAVEQAHKKPYDLVVADIRMDGLDGLEALSQVKSQRPDVGSLVVTGYADDAQSERAERLGLGGLLKKPFDADTFLEAVRQVLAKRQRELARVAREHSLRATADWALEMLAASLGESFPRIGRLARAVAVRMGLAGPQAEEIRVLALVAALKRLQGKDPAVALPETSERLLQHLDARWDESGGEIPLEARIVSVVLAASAQPVGEEENLPSEPLLSRWPGRFDPAVLATLDRVYADTDETTAREGAPETRKGLLSLGRALEQVGDLSGAERAYQKILSAEEVTREGVEALLGLARLRGASGNLEQARETALRVPELGRQLGGASAGSATLAAGLLLARLSDRASALSLLQESEQMLGDAQVEVGAAQARLARRRLASGLLEESDLGHLRTLFEPFYAAELADSIDWLLPLLLESLAAAGELNLARAAGRLVRQFRGQLHRALSLGTLTPAARLAVVKLVAGTQTGEDVLKTLALDADEGVRQAAHQALGSLESQGPEQPLLRIYTLGRFEVYLGEERVPKKAWRSQKNHFLFARVASVFEGRVLDEHLLDEFWPGDPEKARRSLYNATYLLRRGLKSVGLPDELDYMLRTDGGLALNPDLPRWHDLEELVKAAREAEAHQSAGRHAQALNLFRRAAKLYQGPYLDNCFMDWAVSIRNQVEQTVMRCHLHLARAGNEQRRFKEALEHATQLLEMDPCMQEAHLLCMNAQVGLGRPEAAVRQYQLCKKRLARELDMEPSIEVERVHQLALLGLSEVIG